jgi:hypothetical protein
MPLSACRMSESGLQQAGTAAIFSAGRRRFFADAV